MNNIRMNNVRLQESRPSLWERTRRMRFVFLAGVLVGVILGWMLHGIITFAIKFLLVALALGIFVGIFLAWRWFADQSSARRDLTR